jgi:hypothetical protein
MCYELYIVDWIKKHISYDVLITTTQDYIKTRYISYDHTYTFEDYLFDNGFPSGEMYVCFEEFCDNEFQDKEYMRELLNGDEE